VEVEVVASPVKDVGAIMEIWTLLRFDIVSNIRGSPGREVYTRASLADRSLLTAIECETLLVLVDERPGTSALPQMALMPHT
jgi:hypothetical protein